MELQDYLHLLRRRWPTVVLTTVVFVGCAALYLVVAPKRYESSTSLLVSATNLRSVDDLQQSGTFAREAATTYAAIIDSATVLGPVAGDLRPQGDVDDLVGAVTTSVPNETTLIVVTAVAGRADRAAELANAVAAGAARILPGLAPAADGAPLIRLDQTRPAALPTAAVSPNAKRVLVLGFVVGLCLGIAAVIVADTLDTRIRRVDDLRLVTRLPVLAVLPAVKRARRAGQDDHDDLLGPAGEAVRALRTNLRFLETAEQRSLVVTAVADDGDEDEAKVAVNLSRSLAQAGRRVLLVDVDLLEAPVADMLGLDGTTGLADVLTGRAEIGRVVQSTRHTGLFVLPSGTPHLGPTDLLSSPLLAGVLRRVEKEYDYVVLHAPAILRSTDATIVSGATNATLVTVAAGRTREQDLQSALGALANGRITPLGVVLRGGRPGDAQRENDQPPGPVASPPTSTPVRAAPWAVGGPPSGFPVGRPSPPGYGPGGAGSPLAGSPRTGSPPVGPPPGGPSRHGLGAPVPNEVSRTQQFVNGDGARPGRAGPEREGQG